MGISVAVDAELLAEAVRRGGLGSEKETIEEALRLLIADHRGRQAIVATAGIGWEGDIDAMREGRADHSGR